MFCEKEDEATSYRTTILYQEFDKSLLNGDRIIDRVMSLSP